MRTGNPHLHQCKQSFGLILFPPCIMPLIIPGAHRKSFQTWILNTTRAFKICTCSSSYWDKSPYHFLLLFLQNLSILTHVLNTDQCLNQHFLSKSIYHTLLSGPVQFLYFLFIFYPLHRMTFFPSPWAKFWSLNYMKYDLCHEQFEAISMFLRILVYLTRRYLTLWCLLYWSHSWTPSMHSSIVNSQGPVIAT